MILNKKQAILINKALQKLKMFMEIYGDDESESILNQLYDSFEPEKSALTTNLVLIIAVDNKEKSQIFDKYWRTRNVLDIKKDTVTVELEFLGNLKTATEEYLKYIFVAAEMDEDISSDVNEHVLYAKKLLDKGATIVSIRERR